MNRVFGLDLDGVIYPFHESLYTYCVSCRNFNGNYLEFWMDYFPHLSDEECDFLVSNPIVYDMTRPYEYAYKFINKLEETGDSIFYITSRPESLDRITRRYLKRLNFPFQDNLILSKDKVTDCRKYGVTHFVDDFTKHVNPISGFCTSYLVNKPWNQSGRLDTYVVVSNMKELYDIYFGDDNGTN